MKLELLSKMLRFLVNWSLWNHEFTGSQAKLGNALTIAIREELGQWKLVGGGNVESEGGNPTEMEGSYGAIGGI